MITCCSPSCEARSTTRHPGLASSPNCGNGSSRKYGKRMNWFFITLILHREISLRVTFKETRAREFLLAKSHRARILLASDQWSRTFLELSTSPQLGQRQSPAPLTTDTNIALPEQPPGQHNENQGNTKDSSNPGAVQAIEGFTGLVVIQRG
jgi:hypothetical protein